MKSLFLYISVVSSFMLKYFYTQTDNNCKDNEEFVFQVVDFNNVKFLKKFIRNGPFQNDIPAQVMSRSQNHFEQS